MNNKIVILIALVAVVLVVVLFLLPKSPQEGSLSASESDSESENENVLQENLQEDSNEDSGVMNYESIDSQPETDSGTISSEELALHNSKNDCWISYDGEVYDITSFLPKHPGSSAAIEPYCGTSEDFQSAFVGQHGTSKISILKNQGILKGSLA